jgi:predicted alpha/beta hydrolase family esterase
MKQIFIIHGGNAFETYDEYLSYLKEKEITLEKLMFKDWKRNMSQDLGKEYDVIMPQMPNSQNARYCEWKIWFEKLIPLMSESVMLIGHSLGGIFLAKYLSENSFPKKIKATFLVAAPYNTEKQHPLVDFLLSDNLSQFEKQGGEIYIYQSRDDEVVPYTNALSYQKALPKAHIKLFDDRQHFNQVQFPELLADIGSL